MKTVIIILTYFLFINFSFSQCNTSDDDPTYYAISVVYIYQNKSTNSAIKKEVPKDSPVKVTNSFFGDLGWWEICYQGTEGWVEKSTLSYKKPTNKPTVQSYNSTSIVKWDKIDLGDWGKIELPNSMEIQSGIYKKVMDYSKRHFSLNADRVVFQQKGVNNGTSLDTYARVIIRTDYSANELPDFNTMEVTASDLDELNNMYKTELSNAKNESQFPFKIIKWNDVKIITLNGNKCINYSYIRQLNGKPQTYTEFYTFWKGNKQHTLNVEYRLNDKDKWKSDIDKCVQTFEIKN